MKQRINPEIFDEKSENAVTDSNGDQGSETESSEIDLKKKNKKEWIKNLEIEEQKEEDKKRSENLKMAKNLAEAINGIEKYRRWSYFLIHFIVQRTFSPIVDITYLSVIKIILKLKRFQIWPRFFSIKLKKLENPLCN